MINDALQKVKFPAIGLLIGAILNFLLGILVTLSGLLRLIGLIGDTTLPTNQAERIGYLTSTVISYGLGVLSVIIAPLVFWGALKMLEGKKYGLAKTAAVLSVVPFSCCFPLSIIFGIWALVILSKPDVKAIFEGRIVPQYFPPQPPQTW